MHTPTRLLLLCLGILAFARPSDAQERNGLLAGVIRDETGQPLAAVQVYVRTARREIQTDARGEFRIALPAGRHVLQISVVGYASERREVEVTAGTAVPFE